MANRIPHRVVANPAIYDLVQQLAGVKVVHQRLAAQIAKISRPSNMLDIGGGTGIVRHMWPASCRYICVDIDMLKLNGFRSKYPDGLGVMGDATRLPVQSRGVDLVQCIFVMHHIADNLLTGLIMESARALVDGGKIIVIDPLWVPGRWAGRLLWKYDRGSYPRRPETLHDSISTCFSITHWERFAIYHEYILCVAEKK